MSEEVLYTKEEAWAREAAFWRAEAARKDRVIEALKDAHRSSTALGILLLLVAAALGLVIGLALGVVWL